jgi:O-acetyl-ADP-ribose deacetylase (regulator of RNase III)
MGTGIALRVKTLYPSAYQADLVTKHGDISKLGTYSSSIIPHYFFPQQSITVINAYIQYGYGRDRQHLNYGALKTVMIQIREDFAEKTISIPKIGCYNAGGDWSEVRSILTNVFEEREIVVYYK